MQIDLLTTAVGFDRVTILVFNIGFDRILTSQQWKSTEDDNYTNVTWRREHNSSRSVFHPVVGRTDLTPGYDLRETRKTCRGSGDSVRSNFTIPLPSHSFRIGIGRKIFVRYTLQRKGDVLAPCQYFLSCREGSCSVRDPFSAPPGFVTRNCEQDTPLWTPLLEHDEVYTSNRGTNIIFVSSHRWCLQLNCWWVFCVDIWLCTPTRFVIG